MSKNPIASVLPIKLLLLFCLVQITACSDSSEPTGNSTQPVQSDSSTTGQRLATPSASTGTVISIQNSGGYSYIEIDINGQPFWMAASLSAVKPGEKITWNDYAMMKNFTSKSINRTFDQIMFVDKVNSATAMTTRNHSGTVLETMNAAGYSYIRVEELGKNTWLAVPMLEIKVGQSINWESGAAMRNFTSQSLNRSFDEIFFISSVQIN